MCSQTEHNEVWWIEVEKMKDKVGVWESYFWNIDNYFISFK